MKKLKTLDEHNSHQNELYNYYLNDPIPNGIACPKCGSELFDSKPLEILASYPPKKDIACLNKECDYTGYRNA